jgi:hypothetical protein
MALRPFIEPENAAVALAVAHQIEAFLSKVL